MVLGRCLACGDVFDGDDQDAVAAAFESHHADKHPDQPTALAFALSPDDPAGFDPERR